MSASRQDKGLAEDQDDSLIEGALRDGYITRAAAVIVSAVHREVCRACRGAAGDLVELGGATGESFDQLEPWAKTYVNVEPGTFAVTPEITARLHDPRYRLVRRSAEGTTLPGASADVVFAIASFDHIPDSRRALEETRRILRPGGTLILALNNRGSWWKTLLARTAYWRRRREVIARSHFIQWTLAELVAHVSPWLRVVDAYSVVFVPHIRRVWPIIWPVANAIGPRVLPRRGAVSIIVAVKD